MKIYEMEPWTLFLRDGSKICMKAPTGFTSLPSLVPFYETDTMVGEIITLEEMASLMAIQKNEAQIIVNDAKVHFENNVF